jgi:hypothetical protein
MPIGQVCFIPREDVTMRDCTPEEIQEIKRSQDQFSRDKASVTMNTPYGMQYSPHYARQSRGPKTKP